MSTTALSTTNLTLLDRIKRAMPNGSVDQDIVEQLTQRNAFLADAVFKEGNLPTGHQVTSRTGLPSIGWARYNEGTTASKSTSSQFTESTGMLEGWSVVDARLASLNGDEAAFRASEDDAFVAAMSNEVETGFFYHSTKSAPEKFNGLAPRFNATTDPAGGQIILADSGASGSDQTSVWLIGWGDKTVYGLTPKGMPSGLQNFDHGLRPWLDSNSKPYRAYVTEWSWSIGLCVQDWRYVVRIANIDTSALTASGSTGAALIDSMIKATHKIFKKENVRLAWYMNRTVSTFLHLQKFYAVKNSTLKVSDGEGFKETYEFAGIPIRETDAITNTEAALS